MKVGRWVPVLLLVVLALPSLQVPLVLDDWVQRALMSRVFTHVGPWELYTFARDPAQLLPTIYNGPFPWFTLPQLKISFFRPLSVALLRADVWLFGGNVVLARLHSLLWALAMLEAARRLYARLLPRAALLATVLFAVDDSHLMPTLWVANRNSLVAATFALWGLLAHLEWRAGRRHHWLLATGLFALALASAEAALGVLAFVFALELLRPRAERALTALVPLTVLLVAYAALYKLVGAGAWGSATYVDPLREPLVYLRQVPVRFLAVFGAWNSGVGADFWLTTPRLRPLLLACGALAVPGWWWLARTTTLAEPERATLRWLGLGAGLGLLPTLATFPSDRLLLPISLGLCGVLAVGLERAWAQRRRLVLAWAAFAFGVAPLSSWVVTPLVFSNWAAGVSRAVLQPKGVDTFEHRRVVVVSSTDFAVAIYGTAAMANAGRVLPLTWQILSMAPFAHRLTRVDARSLELEVLGGRMLDTVFEQNMRAERFSIIEGGTVELDGLSVTPLRCEGGKPVKLRVQLKLDPADSTFVFWNGRELERLELPEPGQSVELPRAPLLSEQVLGD